MIRIDPVFTRQQKRDRLRSALETAVRLRKSGRLGDRELMAINIGTAETLDAEELGPTLEEIQASCRRS